ncbi:hypothetical protein GQ53DRAFT_627339, partial [Thozetella sp. PMI_491]
MATTTRQPFAPLDGARLQTLTSLKNRQNAAVSNAPVKRKASEVDDDDFENVDPILFSKRSKGGENMKPSNEMDYFKPSAFVLTKAVSTPSIPQPSSPPQAASTSSRPRSFLQPKSPAAKLNTSISSPSLTAPAGRSPTRGSKRIGILSKRRTARVAPPAFGLGGGAAAPFSLDAALKGTIPSYGGRSASSSISSALSSGSLQEPELKSSWFFDIHEDTPEQEMTNLLQHSTCTLDISSDEESEQRASRERAEGRDKENIPPADDVSQTSRAVRGAAATSEDDMMIEKARGPLAEMNAADYYAKGCDDTSVVVVPGDEDEDDEQHLQQAQPAPEQAPALAGIDTSAFEFAPELKLEAAAELSVDAIMGKEELGDKAAVLAPIDGAGESFELWESGSVKDEAD